jgi:hypothetical protein
MKTIGRDSLEYIPKRRYIIRINDEKFGDIYFSRRIRSRKKALDQLFNWNRSGGLLAELFDTKTGETVQGETI